MTTPFDVAVMGPGPAGSACAAVLAQAGWRVALVGPLAGEAHRTGEVIGPKARRQLAAADDLSGIPVRYIASGWSGSGLDMRDLRVATGRVAVAAARPALDHHLLAEACTEGVSYFPEKVLQCARHDAAWRVNLAGSTTFLAARYVVEATGRSGRSPAFAGAGRHYLDRMVVLWCLVEPEDGGDVLHLAATSDGWWYRVPSGHDRAFLALATDADLIPISARDHFFETRAAGTQFATDAKRRSSPLRVVDARTSLRLPQSAPGWIPIGDAAFSLDPLSGDGVSRALADGVEVARALTSSHSPINATLELRDFAAARMRRAMHLLTMRAAFYAAERRWPQSPFWVRRNRSQLGISAR